MTEKRVESDLAELQRIKDSLPPTTPESEAAFDEWLSNPDNKRRWDEALAAAKARMGGAQ